MEIVDDAEVIVRTENEVLEKWRRDFENLYNGGNSDEFDNEHYNQAKFHKHLLEANMENPLFVFVFIPNEILNNNITLDEIHDIVTHAKSN